MSSGSNVAVSYSKETSYKVLPGSPVFTSLRNVSESIKPNYSFIESNEVTTDRTTADTVLAGLTASGDINGELSWGAYDDFWEWLLQSTATWAAAITLTGVDITVAATNKFNRATGSFSTDGWTTGIWVRSRLLPNSSNNGWHYITGVTGPQLTVLPADLVVDATTSASSELKSGRWIRNGATQVSFSLERQYSDLTATEQYVIVPGCILAGARFGIGAGKINDVTFNVLASEEVSETATVAASLTAAPTNPVMNAIRNVKAFREDHTALKIVSMNCAVGNNPRGLEAVGVLGADDIISGSFTTEITIEAYYRTKALADKARAETETSITIVVEDNSGNSYVFWFPRLKIVDSSRVGGGKNTDVKMLLRLSALKGAKEQMQIARWVN